MLEYGRNNNKLFGGNYMIEYKKIIIKNKKQYIKNERKNFSYYTFNQYDLPQLEFAYSFFRSDFRGATFDNVTLLETDFDRSDFIDSRFLNSNFISVKFGASENKNAVYKCCNFNSCSYKGAVFTTTIFSECIFKNIHFICNFDRCKFINCQFINCQFNRSSVEECTFLKCELTDTDLAQCHAENLIFIDTFLQNVFLGAPFIPNYLIRNTNISDAKLKYRGKIVPITKYTELFENTLYQQKRYFELLNISIIVKKIFSYDYFLSIFNEVVLLDELYRKFHINNIIKMLDFYFSYKTIDLITYFKIIDYLNKYDWEKFHFEESLQYKANLYVINEKISNYCYDYDYLNTISSDTKCLYKIRLNCEQKEVAINKLKEFINQFKKINPEINDNIEVLEIEKGSIILTILGSLQLAALTGLLVKKSIHDSHNDKVKMMMHNENMKKYQELLSKAKTPTKVKEINDVFKEYLFDDNDEDYKKFNNLANSIFISEIITIIISLIV